MESKKIIFIVNDLGFLLSHRSEIIFNCIKKGMSVGVICFNAKNKDLKLLKDKNINCFELNTSKFINNFLALYNFIQIIKKIKPNICHAITYKAIFFLGISRLLFKKKFIAIYSIAGRGKIFGSPTKFNEKILKSIFTPLLLIIFRYEKKNSVIIVQNNEDKKYIKSTYGQGLNLTKISGSGVDLNFFKKDKIKKNKKKIYIVMTSRLLVQKGIEEFCILAQKLTKKKN